MVMLLTMNFCFAGGSNWPGVKYSYAMVYLYNVDGNLRGSHQILKEGKLDKTVQGEGKKLTDEQASKLEKIFASGSAIDELVNGLSGCYIPRHAIVYYDEKDQPVASMSICFECQGIRFYSPSYPRNHYSSNDKLVKKAEEKLKEMEEIVKSLGFETQFKQEEIKPIMNNGVMTITDGLTIDNLLPEKVTFENFKDYLTNQENMKTLYDEKYTYGGEKFIFIQVDKGKSMLYFSGSDEKASLEKASVKDNDIQLCKSVKIGMTTEEIQSLMPVYDGISEPSEIIIQNEDGSKKISFKLNENKLIQYDLEVRVW
jgi:hypothetical protein